MRVTYGHDVLSIKHVGELAGCVLREGDKLTGEDALTNR